MTREQVKEQLRELGFTIRRVWIDEAGHLAVDADGPFEKGEDRAVLSSRFVLILSEYYKAHGGSGLKCATPVEVSKLGETDDGDRDEEMGSAGEGP